MVEHQTSYGVVKELPNHVFEVIVNQGVKVNGVTALEEHKLWTKICNGQPFKVLLNCLYPFEYDFDGAMQVGTHPLQRKIAIIAYDQDSYTENAMASQINQITTDEMKKVIQIFDDYNEGLTWLNHEG